LKEGLQFSVVLIWILILPGPVQGTVFYFVNNQIKSNQIKIFIFLLTRHVYRLLEAKIIGTLD